MHYIGLLNPFLSNNFALIESSTTRSLMRLSGEGLEQRLIIRVEHWNGGSRLVFSHTVPISPFIVLFSKKKIKQQVLYFKMVDELDPLIFFQNSNSFFIKK